ILDNSGYQAWMVLKGTSFDPRTWNAYVNTVTSLAIPGAVEFAKYADAKGVKVFYISNRTAEEEAPTRKNLEKFGFPMGGGVDTMLMTRKQPDWGSAKGTRLGRRGPAPRRPAARTASRRMAMAVMVGFIGVGNMGNPMAYNVLKAPFPMTVFDMNPKATENLVQAGAKRAGSSREVVENSEIVLTSLPASPDVEAVYLEPGGLVERAKAGTILIDLSSVLPSTPRKIEPRAKA